MKRLLGLSILLLTLASSGFGAYTYYFSATNMASFNWSQWTHNGSLTDDYSSDGYYGLDADSGPGALISNVSVPGGSSNYEGKMKIRCSSCSTGTFGIFLRASSNSEMPSGPGYGTIGTYYLATLTISSYGSVVYLTKLSGGTTTFLGSAYYGYSAPVGHDGMIFRAFIRADGTMGIIVDNYLVMTYQDTSITSGMPGFGISQTYGHAYATELYLGPIDSTAPSAINSSNISTSSFSNRVDAQFSGLADDVNGVGLASVVLKRNGTTIGGGPNVFTDTTVSPSTTYTYSITAKDYHLNQTTSTFTVTTPASGSIDPRRVGVRPSGAYWGAKGEQVDLLSGNLNYTIPLISAKSRGGWAVPISLTYNSQNWRKDGSGAVWNLGRDVGYGYGWKLLAGSLTPYWSDYWTLDHYLFIDASGAEYRLNVNTSGVWTTSEGLLLRYEDSTKKLFFPDGSFWMFGSISGGDEPDAGTSYPTTIEDTNGNQITIAYDLGNSSARILTIEDVLAVSHSGRHTYAFTYDGSNHLTNITNLNADAAGHSDIEDYTFTYSTATTLTDPFSSAGFGSVKMLQTTVLANSSLSLTTTFTTDASGSLTKVTFPAGGYIRWQHANATYVGSRLQPEVLNRYISADGSTENTYSIARDSGDSSRNVHLYASITDPGGIGKKVWNFDTTSSSFTVGLVTSTEGWQLPGTPVKLLQNDYTWMSSGSQRVQSVITTTDPGPNQYLQKNTWSYDSYGNVAGHNLYIPFSSINDPRYFTYSYLTDSNYTSKYITNRLVSTTAGGYSGNGGSPTYFSPGTVATNYYDADSSSPCYAGGYGTIASISSPNEHDSTYGTGFSYRGNLTAAVTVSGGQCAKYDMLGNSPTLLDTVGRTHSTTITSGTNYAAPDSSTMGSYSESAAYNSLLDPITQAGLNGSTGITYDSYERPDQITSPLGVVTTYTYNTSPPWVKATTNGRWTKTTYDGLGRPILAESGSGAFRWSKSSVTRLRVNASKSATKQAATADAVLQIRRYSKRSKVWQRLKPSARVPVFRKAAKRIFCVGSRTGKPCWSSAFLIVMQRQAS